MRSATNLAIMMLLSSFRGSSSLALHLRLKHKVQNQARSGLTRCEARSRLMVRLQSSASGAALKSKPSGPTVLGQVTKINPDGSAILEVS